MTTITLECRAAEVPRARRAVRAVLGRCPAAVVDTVEQCAAETVGNAIEHSESATRSGTVTLVVAESGDRVRVEVHDDGSAARAPAVRAAPGPDAEGGRGLLLVEALSDAWGTEAGAAGRTVWFEVTVRPA